MTGCEAKVGQEATEGPTDWTKMYSGNKPGLSTEE